MRRKLRKLTLNINGADRMFICDPENDTLASVLRRLGLTGTKVGCGTGVCGSCSVILNDKVIRSCTKKIKAVEEYSRVTTIEGIGAPNYLHPLQVAFMHKGAVQCGFCSPGFIVSAYALLKENSAPTREEIRDWFQKHRNICRCTGYKQIVDAVFAAAKVMRGECSLKDIMVKLPEDGEYYGKPLVRPAALAKVCGVCDYGDDVALKMPEGTLHAVFVQPKVAYHAKLIAINKDEAEKMPGVYKIITHENVPGSNKLMWYQCNERTLVNEPHHHLLVEDKILNYGDVVALVVADTLEHARAAADKVTIEWEQLTEYRSYLEAVMPDAERIYERHPNIWSEQPVFKGKGIDTAELIDNAYCSVEGSFYSSREPHMPIEGDTVQAYWDEDDMLTIHCKTQMVYLNLADIATATALPMEKIRVVENPTGGTFGAGIAAASYALAAIACLACDNLPVALDITYEEFMAHSGKRAPAYTNGRLSCNENGMITGLEYDCGIDHGAYNELGDDLLQKTSRFMLFPYNVPNVMGLSRVAVTNHSYGTAYRGYGSPQIYTAGEALVDMLAEKMDIDPFEFRWRNIARPGDHNINSYPFNHYPMEKIMEEMKPIYEKAKARAEEEDTAEKRRGVGLAWGGYNVTGGPADQCSVALELRNDGKIIKYDTWEDQGQGGDVGSLQVTLEALKPLKLKPEDIVLIQNDSKYCPDSGAAASSRMHYMDSQATVIAANQMLKVMEKSDGSYRTYDEMIAEGLPVKFEGSYTNVIHTNLCGLDPNTGVGNPSVDYTYGLFLAEVEVDTKTGKTTVIAYHAVVDVGVIGNIASVNGQAYGGLSHCIGFALSEEYEDAEKQNNILTAGIPTIKDIPDDFNIHHVTTYRELNPFGSSGASEAFQSSGHMAVINAINNACGVRIYELPARPQKVKAGLDALARGEKLEPPKKYFLGSDLIEELEYISQNPIVSEGEIGGI